MGLLELRALDFPFTTRDTPALREHVASDLSEIVSEIARRDRAARGVILTGGFSRGEGSAVADAPVNDYDLVVTRARPTTGASYARLSVDLEKRVGIAVDLHPVWRGRLKAVPPKIFWFDVRHGGRAIAGADDVERIPDFEPGDLSAAEAARLLFNRAVGLLEALPEIGGAPDVELVNRQAAKAILAGLDARLVLGGLYASTYRERLARSPTPLAAWATAYKLDPERKERRDLAKLWEEARAELAAALTVAIPAAGWGTMENYPKRAPFDAVESAWGLLKGARPLDRPSHAIRGLTLSLLKRATFPEGIPEDPEVETSFKRLGAATGPAVPRLLALRARTLQ